MTYAESIEALYSLRWFGAKLDLENTLALARMTGNPERGLRFIHVAGTNGKGSTCAILESIYRAAGLKTGLFTSPHLVAFGERIQVNRQPISPEEIVSLIEEIWPLLRLFDGAGHPTFFEVVTVMALLHFARNHCDLVLWETGLGGRLDATNIVTPIASVITNIQYDHQKWLGETLPSIAREKAGIIKPGIPVITGTDASDALDVIARRAHELASPLTVLPHAAALEPPLDSIRLPLLGEHQKLNAALALATVRTVSPLLPVSQAEIVEGLSTVSWPGRLQVVNRPSGQTLLLDGAHNPAGASILASALRDLFRDAKPTLILGILRDKDWQAMCALLAPCASRLLLVPVHSERTAEPHSLAGVCHDANAAIPTQECASLAEAMENSASAPFVVVAGSLYLIGEAMELLRLSPVPESSGNGKERRLNEWSQTGCPSLR